jgi:hypothetical protein
MISLPEAKNNSIFLHWADPHNAAMPMHLNARRVRRFR